VFNGTPAEVTAGWPIIINSNHTLSSPVYDSVSGIIRGDSSGRLSYVWTQVARWALAPRQPSMSRSIDAASCGERVPFVDGPILDGTSGFVFAVNGTDTLNHGTICRPTPNLTSAYSSPSVESV